MPTHALRFPSRPRRIAAGLFLLLTPIFAAGPATAASRQDRVPDAPTTVFVRAQRVIVRPGVEWNDAAVLVQGGRIVAVGQGLEAPAGARVIEGAVVTAGFIDAWGAIGMDTASVSDRSATASAAAFDAFDPYRNLHLREEALAAGITSVRVSIGRDGRTGGMSAVVRNDLDFDLERSVLLRDASLAATVGSAAGADVFTRLDEVDRLVAELEKGRRHAEALAKYKKDLADWEEAIRKKEAELDKEFKKAKRDREKAIEDAKKEGKEHKETRYREDNKPRMPRFDPDADILARVVAGALPLVVEIDRAQDLRALLDKTKDYKSLRMVIAGAADGRLFADELAARGIPVIVLPQKRERGVVQDLDEFALAAELAEKGVSILLGSGGVDAQAARELPLFAALAVGRGLPREVALAALTTAPARFLDVSDRVGSIERGKDADLLVLSGDPLSTSTQVLAVLLAGDVAWQRP